MDSNENTWYAVSANELIANRLGQKAWSTWEHEVIHKQALVPIYKLFSSGSTLQMKKMNILSICSQWKYWAKMSQVSPEDTEFKNKQI